MSYQTFSQDFLAGLVNQAIASGQGQIHNLQYVFPNRRAGMFFGRSLKKNCQQNPDFKVFLMPLTQSLDEFACSLSPLRQLDQTGLLFRLYQSYKIVHLQHQPTHQPKEALSFDKFLFWGTMLLADYQDTTESMASPERLFGLVSDHHQLDENISIDSQEAELIARYLPKFKAQLEQNQGAEGFLSFWELMLPLYTHFVAALKSDKLAFAALITQDAVEHVADYILPPNRKIIFAGFSQLSRAEAALIHALLSKYPDHISIKWDLHPFFIKEHAKSFQAAAALSNARRFGLINQNLNEHLSQSIENLNKSGQPATVIHATACPLQISQIKHAAWLAARLMVDECVPPERIAIVLPGAELLIPLINSLPKIEQFNYGVNVTIRYPIRSTPVFSLVNLLLDMQSGSQAEANIPEAGRYLQHNVLAVLRHSYIVSAAPEPINKLSKIIENSKMFWVNSGFIKSQAHFYDIEHQQTQHLLTSLFDLLFANKKQNGLELAGWLYKILITIYQCHNQKLNSKENENPDEANTTNIDNLKNTENISESLPINIKQNEDSLRNNSWELDKEYIYFACQQLARLQTTALSYPIQNDLLLWSDLIIRFLENTQIPFFGDPIDGIQILGLLESQNLDFDHVIFVDAGEGKLPVSQNEPTFIPQQMRKMFGLSQISDTEARYAYLISRMLYRAKSIYFLYQSAGSNAEKSRFLLQFDYIMGLEIKYSSLQNLANTLPSGSISIPKTGPLVRKTLAQYSKGSLALSPNSLSVYLSCKLLFFYTYILKLERPSEQLQNQDNITIGNIVHTILKEAVEYCSEQSVGIPDAARLEEFKKSIPNLSLSLLKNDSPKLQEEPILDGQAFLNNEIIIELANISIDRQIGEIHKNPDLKIIKLEKEMKSELNLDYTKADLVNGAVQLKGIVDRIDKLASGYRILDYKTSKSTTLWQPKQIQELFDGEKKQAFQLMFYAWMLQAELAASRDSENISAGLVWLYNEAETQEDTLSPDWLKIGSVEMPLNQHFAAFEQLLKTTLEELFSSQVPFGQTKNQALCTYCNFNNICRRS